MKRRSAVLTVVVLLSVTACSPPYPGAAAIDRVASESVFVDTPQGLDQTAVNTAPRCWSAGSDASDPVNEGSMTREVATDRPLDPWLTDLIAFYSQRAEADGWTITSVTEDDPSVEERGIDALLAERVVDGTPMFLQLHVSIQWPGQGLYRFWLYSWVKEGTYCR